MSDELEEYDSLLDNNGHRWRGRLIALALAVLVSAGVASALWTTVLSGGDSAANPVQTAEVQRGSIVKTITTSATATSQSTANLSFGTSGRVTAVYVSVGQAVKRGDVLAELESTALQNALARAQINLSSAQAKLSQLLEGSGFAELASADQSVIQAQANFEKADAALEDLLDGPTAAERDAAQHAVLAAQAQLTKAQAARADLDAAWEDAVANAEAAVEQAEEGLESAEQAADEAADALALAGAKLENAETAYCACDSSPSFCTSFGVPLSASDEAVLLDIAADVTAACSTQASLVLTANNGYKSARSAAENAENAIGQAEEALQSAEEALAQLGSGPDSDDIASADLAVAQAELALSIANENLAELERGPSEEEVLQAQRNVESAAAALASAQAKRDEVYRGADEDEMSAQRDQVRLAQIAVEEAEKDLEKARIIAPFDGTVAALNIAVGDMVGASGTSASTSSSNTSAAIVLNTPQALVLNVSIGESDLRSVKAGQSGYATFDAISDRVFPIVIDSVGTSPTTTQGVVTYQAKAHIVSEGSAALPGSSRTGRLTAGQQGTTEGRLQEGGLADEQRPALEARATPAGPGTEEEVLPAPGMNASVTIIVDRAEDVLILPSSAVQAEGTVTFVTVRNDDGSTEKVAVETGLSDDTYTEIRSGLEEGQIVIIPGVTAISVSPNQTGPTGRFFTGPGGNFSMPVGPGPGGAAP